MLDAQVLGMALYNRRKTFDDKPIQVLINEHGSLENVRKAMSIADAEEIINHFKSFAAVPGTGLAAPPNGGVVTGSAKIV
jgi:hypothetical protein